MKGTIGIAAVASALAFTVSLHAQGTQGTTRQEPRQTVGTTGAVAAANVEDIVDEPENYYGERVTVSAKVSEVLGKRMFRIREEGVVDVDDTLLVINPQQKRAAAGAGTAGTTGTAGAAGTAGMGDVLVTEDATVQVHGTVRRFVRNDLEREYGIDFADWGVDDAWFNANNGRPVLIADRIDVRR